MNSRFETILTVCNAVVRSSAVCVSRVIKLLNLFGSRIGPVCVYA